MSNIILVRHAQASLGRENYDQLSELGFKQAELLGKYFTKHRINPAAIISGDLARHQQTAEQIHKAFEHEIPRHIDKDWNEFEFKRLIQIYLTMHPKERPADGDVKAFFSILKKSMLAWSNDELEDIDEGFESWKIFSERVSRAIGNTSPHPEKPTLVVSSGGAIAMLLMQILQAPPKVMIDLNFQIRNTSFTEIITKPHKKNLVAFNQIHHLSETGKSQLITFA